MTSGATNHQKPAERVSLSKTAVPMWCMGDGARELRGALVQRTAHISVTKFAPYYVVVATGAKVSA